MTSPLLPISRIEEEPRCPKKVAYTTPEAAEAARKRSNRRQSSLDRRYPLHAYHCPECGFWHLGHKIKETIHLHPPRRPEHRKNWRTWRRDDD